ncbi:hypothetical protein EJB05_56400 [Eragrostis curvula]|uniref:Serine/threonine-protein kinase BSK1-like TPR repeats domain-containing protein n=1 Tax=Eragrostis curvula TaxID=38414 RepID=A0A5J9SGE8_9POAL|nr:hypothetical protein EJB05_56400 [Eragrostis curvula]
MSVDEAVAQVEAPWSKRHGPLHMAAAAGKLKACKVLIEQFKVNVNGTGTDGATPLHFAIYDSGSTNVVKLLLENGADPNQAYSNGVAPLHIATVRGAYEITELLLSKGADVDPMWEYKTPLSIAAQRGSARMIELLLQYKADPNTYITHTPLKAAVLGHSQVAVELLIEAGANVNAGMPDTPLIIAATAGLTDIVMCLLNSGANANISNENGITPVEIAAIQGHQECVEVLFPATNPLAEVADWSIDGVTQYALFASSQPQDLLHESEFEAEGDAAFFERDYSFALTLYTMAIEIEPDESTLYAKRSLCFLRTGHEDKALEDAQAYKCKHPDLSETSLSKEPLLLVMEFGEVFEALNLG